MRLPLLLAAGAALAATAVPAQAAYFPACAASVRPGAAQSSCNSGNTPMLTRRVTRVVDLVAVSGTVTASVTCYNYPYANTSASRTLTGPATTRFSVVEYGGSCTTKLSAVSAGATGAATSTFTVRIDPEPAR